MLTLSVDFPQPLTNVVSQHARVMVCLHEVSNQVLDARAAREAQQARERQMAQQIAATRQVANSLSQKLDSIREEIELQRRNFATQVANAAAEIVRTLVDSESDFSFHAAEKFIARAAEGNSNEGPVSISVHPDVHETLGGMIDRSRFNLIPDARIPKGDCLVDFGETGTYLSLDHQLMLLKTHIIEAIVESELEQ